MYPILLKPSPSRFSGRLNRGNKNGLKEDVETKLLPVPAAACPRPARLILCEYKSAGLNLIVWRDLCSWGGILSERYFSVSGSDDDIATIVSPNGDVPENKIRRH